MHSNERKRSCVRSGIDDIGHPPCPCRPSVQESPDSGDRPLRELYSRTSSGTPKRVKTRLCGLERGRTFVSLHTMSLFMQTPNPPSVQTVRYMLTGDHPTAGTNLAWQARQNNGKTPSKNKPSPSQVRVWPRNQPRETDGERREPRAWDPRQRRTSA